ncbi:glycerol-3-phosphate 1-O-acyltransferase PlsB [Dolichospermum sp. ST_sed1]|nr:glycerol-3-phosphate 1-O-acyltransferase PlsB [Dolichospermum sp. ST_sed1]
MSLSNNRKNSSSIFFWIQNIIYLWVRSRTNLKSIADDLALDPSKPVCYVFRTQSYTDLWIADFHCQKLGLPRPEIKIKELQEGGDGAYIYLAKRGFVQRKTSKDAPSALYGLVQQVVAKKDDIQIVPVSVFWGRDPGKEEKSIFKLLFFDDQYGGWFQRFIQLFVHGRNVVCHFGRPISLINLINEKNGIEQTTKKVRRVLKIHFRSLRISTLGPYIYDHAQVVNSILTSKRVKDAMADEASRRNATQEKILKIAKRYVVEISAKKTPYVIQAVSIFLTWLWNKLFSGVEISHDKKLQELADGGYEIIYLPCHRSHLDYLLISYVLYHLGFVTPHIAAGINLNFAPVGSVLRRSGAFFLRRSFRGNKLYTIIFNEYLHYLITKGYSLKFFPEGGRSRTGKLKKPMTGMLAMAVRSYILSSEKPVVLVPTYVGYDKVIETGSYLKELGGKSKKSESMGQLLKSLKILGTNFGRAYVGFGEPIFLQNFLDKELPDWKEKSEWYGNNASKLPAINNLANEIMVRINSTAVVSPSSLFSLALLSSQKKALSEKDLLSYVCLLIDYANKVPYSCDITIPKISAKEQLSYLESVIELQRFSHPDGDVIHLDEVVSIKLTYYRNNVLHVFAVPAVIAAFFLHNDQITIEELRLSCKAVYPYLKDELFLRWDMSDFDHELEKAIDFMSEKGLLIRQGDLLSRPVVADLAFNELNLLGRSLGRIIERYAVFAAVLSQYSENDSFDRKEIENKSQSMAHKIAILNGTNDPDFFDKGLFSEHIQLLVKMKVLETAVDGKLKINPILAKMTEKSMSLLSNDVRQSICKEANWSKGK